jgi:hypothetical protein
MNIISIKYILLKNRLILVRKRGIDSLLGIGVKDSEQKKRKNDQISPLFFTHTLTKS